MEKIIIKNFGPIKDIELEIKDINVFIGSTSSGKSTVAKLIAIFRENSVNSYILMICNCCKTIIRLYTLTIF